MANESIQTASPAADANVGDEKPAAVQHVVSADIETAIKPVNVEDAAFIPVGGLTMSEEERKLVSGVGSTVLSDISSDDSVHLGPPCQPQV